MKNFEISQSYASEIEASIPAPKKKLSKLGSSFNLSRVSPENEYYFKIAPKEGAISNSKTYFLVCSSVHEMKEWIQVLQEASHSNSVSTVNKKKS